MTASDLSDLSDTIAPNSDQLDAVDLISGPRTFTITSVDVKKGAEQPVTIGLAEFDRPWRPGLSMRRVLIACWGPDGSTYVGRRVRLFCDPSVVFGGAAVGGTRIEALSDIKGAQKVPLLITRGKSGMFTVKPLADAPAPAAPERTVEQRADAMVAAFEGLGVDVEQLERKLGRERGQWTADDLDSLQAVGRSINAGETTAAAAFPGGAT